MRAKGRIWKFGDDVNTDLIIPGKYLENYDPRHLAAHAMEGASKEFASGVAEGDMIVAGKNFGCGSSREQAVIALKQAGISAVVARSFARIFYRNAINLGMPVLVSQDAVSIFEEGDFVRVDSEAMVSEDGKKRAKIDGIPDQARRILDVGGLVPYVKGRLKQSGKT